MIFTTSVQNRRTRWLLSITALTILSTSLAIGQGSAGAEQLQGSMPEAIAIVDISESANCAVVYRTYSDASRQTVVEETVPVPCQGGVIQTFGTTIADAEANGYDYVVLTGDIESDLAAVNSIKFSKMAENGLNGPASESETGTAAACNPTYKSATFSWPAYGIILRGLVYYNLQSNCFWAITDALQLGGADVWWYGIYYQQHSIYPCIRTNSSHYVRRWVGRTIGLGSIYSHETIWDGQSQFPGCNYWGISATGGVRLN